MWFKEPGVPSGEHSIDGGRGRAFAPECQEWVGPVQKTHQVRKKSGVQITFCKRLILNAPGRNLRD